MSSARQTARRFNSERIGRRLVAYLKNFTVFAVSAILAFELRFDGAIPARYLPVLQISLGIWVGIKMVAFMAGSVNQEQGRRTSIYEAKRIIFANTAGSIAGGIVILLVLGPWGIPRSLYALEWILSCFLLLGWRLIARVMETARKMRQTEGLTTKALIYGAGSAGLALLWELRQNPSLMLDVVGLIDDNPQTAGLIFDGKPVLGPGEELSRLVRKHGIKIVLISIPSATKAQMARILKLVADSGADCKMVPGLSDWIWGSRSGLEQFGGIIKSEIFHEERKPVLLIGGAGYIGSGLLPKLLDSGYRVRLLDAFLYGDDPIARWKDHPNLEVVNADFRRVDVVVRAMQGVQAVIHLGAIVGDPACALDEELTIETNLLATRMIAEVTKGQGIERFIFASSCSVYGASDSFLHEDSALHPVSLYARSKIACENVLLDMKTDTFRPVILRFSTIYGLSGRIRFDLVVNLLTAKAIVDKAITVFGSDQWRPFLHVDDAALAVHCALKAPEHALRQMIFNVGSDDQNYTLGDVGRLIKSLVPAADLQFYDNDSIDRRNYRVDFSRINRCMTFATAWKLEDGIHQVIDTIRSGHIKDYRSPLYSNARFLSEEIGPQSLRFAQQRWIRDVLEARSNNMVSAT